MILPEIKSGLFFSIHRPKGSHDFNDNDVQIFKQLESPIIKMWDNFALHEKYKNLVHVDFSPIEKKLLKRLYETEFGETRGRKLLAKEIGIDNIDMVVNSLCRKLKLERKLENIK